MRTWHLAALLGLALGGVAGYLPGASAQPIPENCGPGRDCRANSLQLAGRALADFPTCSTSRAGQLRYDTTSKQTFLCNGTAWQTQAASADGGSPYTHPDPISLTGIDLGALGAYSDGGFRSAVATGANGFACVETGCRVDLGGTALDYIYSEFGNYVNVAGEFQTRNGVHAGYFEGISQDGGSSFIAPAGAPGFRSAGSTYATLPACVDAYAGALHWVTDRAAFFVCQGSGGGWVSLAQDAGAVAAAADPLVVNGASINQLWVDAGPAHFRGNVWIDGGLFVGQSLYVDGGLEVQKASTIRGALTVSGAVGSGGQVSGTSGSFGSVGGFSSGIAQVTFSNGCTQGNSGAHRYESCNIMLGGAGGGLRWDWDSQEYWLYGAGIKTGNGVSAASFASTTGSHTTTSGSFAASTSGSHTTNSGSFTTVTGGFSSVTGNYRTDGGWFTSETGSISVKAYSVDTTGLEKVGGVDAGQLAACAADTAGARQYVYSPNVPLVCDGVRWRRTTATETFSGHSENTAAKDAGQTLYATHVVGMGGGGTLYEYNFITTTAGVGAGNADFYLTNENGAALCGVTVACASIAGTVHTGACPNDGGTVYVAEGARLYMLAATKDDPCTQYPEGNSTAAWR